MFFNRNEIWVGLVMGLIIPFVGFAVLLMIFEQIENLQLGTSSGFSLGFRKRTVAIVAICLNIFPLNQFQKRRMTQSIRGLVLATFALVAVWLINYGPQLFG